MNSWKKWITIAASVALFSLPMTQVEAASCDYDYACGQCYQECRSAPQIAPAIVLGAVVIAAVVAVAVQNSQSSHAH